MAGRRSLISDVPRVPTLTNILARSSDDNETVVVPPRVDESGGIDPGGGSGLPEDTFTAYDVYMTLLSIPIRHNVRLDNQALVDLIGTRGWMTAITRGEHNAMQAFAARLEKTEAELGRVDQLIEENGTFFKRFRAFMALMFRRKPAVMSTGIFRGLGVKKCELEEKARDERMARERLDHTAWSGCNLLLLTDAGRKIMSILDREKGDPRMEKMSVDAYLELIRAEKKK